jgi:hypothetical protein
LILRRLLFIPIFTKWSFFHGISFLPGMTFSFEKKEEKRRSGKRVRAWWKEVRSRSGTGAGH